MLEPSVPARGLGETVMTGRDVEPPGCALVTGCTRDCAFFFADAGWIHTVSATSVILEVANAEWVSVFKVGAAGVVRPGLWRGGVEASRAGSGRVVHGCDELVA
jgi:hypothetical protein